MECALCGKNKKLMQSHIIPKLVYKRIKSKDNSRFRSLDNITKIWQDGEKRPMLCHDCEELFSSYEVKFASVFLDNYLINEKVQSVNNGVIQNYILTVAWRILWDDLHRMNSHKDHFARGLFEEFSKELADYLLKIGKGNNCKIPNKFRNYVYKLENLVNDEAITKLAEGCLFGYSIYFGNTNTVSVIAYYAGLVFVTDYNYDKSKYIFINHKSILFKSFAKKKEIRDEMIIQFCNIAEQYKRTITPEVRTKIKKYYDTH